MKKAVARKERLSCWKKGAKTNIVENEGGPTFINIKEGLHPTGDVRVTKQL